MIPQEKLAAVTRAVRETFGPAEIEDIATITKGRSGALVYRIVVRGSPFLLRIVTRTEDPTLPHHFACMKLAADAGLAPRLLHTSLDDRLSITDFVETTPLPMHEAFVRMPATLRALHALPAFPKRADHLNTSCTFLLNKGVASEGYIGRIKAANIFPKPDSDELFARYEQVTAAYASWAPDMVSSHNDLFKPDNILFDRTRVWLVDWEAAFLNDRYADLAVVANMLAGSDEEERAFLENYLGEPADEHRLARLFVMRQLAHIFYAMAFLYLGSLASASAGSPIDWNRPAPDLNDTRRRIWIGEADMVDSASKIAYGRTQLQQLLENVNRSRFNESLEMVKQAALQKVDINPPST